VQQADTLFANANKTEVDPAVGRSIAAQMEPGRMNGTAPATAAVLKNCRRFVERVVVMLTNQRNLNAGTNLSVARFAVRTCFCPMPKL